MKETVSPVGFRKLLIIGVLLINVAIIVLVGLSIRQSRLQYEEQAAITTQNLSHALEEYINGVITKADVALLSVADEAERQLASGRINSRAINAYILRQHGRIPEIDGLRMTNAKGDILYGTDVAPGVNVSDRDYFINTRNELKPGLFISKPIVSRTTRNWAIIIARRYNHPNGSFAGEAHGVVSLDNFSKMFSKINVGKHGIIVLLDNDRSIICRYTETHGTDSSIGKRYTSAEIQELFRRGETSATYRTRSGIDGVYRTHSYRKISFYPMYMVVGLAQDEYLTEWRKETTKMLALVALFLLVVLFLAWLLYRDVTERKKMEEDLLRTKKLESIAILSKGIAHDFNNMLTSVLGFISLAKTLIPPSDQAHKYLTVAESSCEKAKELTQQLDKYASGVTLEKKIASLTRLLQDSSELLSKHENIKVNKSIPDNLWSADMDERQISHVMHELLENAGEAMPNGGVIDISAKNTVVSSSDLLPLQEGNYIKISVKDQGVGISKENLSNIFEPYFTTKQMDYRSGVGLGLALCYSIIRGHKGYIVVESEPGKGTAVDFYLPAEHSGPCRPVIPGQGDHLLRSIPINDSGLKPTTFGSFPEGVVEIKRNQPDKPT